MSEENKEKYEKRISDLEAELKEANTKKEEDNILKRLEKAEKALQSLESKIGNKPKDKNNDDECCPECGGDLTEILKDVYQCDKCGEKFEDG